MNYFSDREKKYHYRQSGVATLAVSVGVALLMAVAAVGMMRSGLLEQKIAANDLRMREAQEIAERGMARVISSSSLFEEECPSLNSSGFIEMEREDFIFPNSDNIFGPTTNEAYRNLVLQCYNSSNEIYFVRSQALIPSPEPDKNPVVKAFVEGWFQKRKSLINEGVGLPSVFLVNGDFCKDECNQNGNGGGGPKILNSIGVPGVEASGGTVNIGVFSTYQADKEKPNSVLMMSAGSAWNYVFDIKFDDAKKMATQNPGEPFYFFQGVNNINNSVPEVKNGALGSKEKPVVLILEAYLQGSGQNQRSVCPTLGIKVFGVVYIKGPCDYANGWGNAEIYGSVISDGSLDKFTANSEHYKFEETSWNYLKNKKSEAFLVPGTWRDFEPQS